MGKIVLKPWRMSETVCAPSARRLKHYITPMSQPTRRQHYVPDFYLTQWVDPQGQITCHDLTEGKTFACDPANVLVQSYFYEEDPSQPDNRIEKILAEMEGTCSVTFKKLFAPGAVAADEPRKAAAALQALITSEDADNLSQFAASSYAGCGEVMIDQETYRQLKAEIETRTAADRQLLDKLRADVRPLRDGTKRIHPRAATSVSLVATDGGNNSLRFDPFMVPAGISILKR